MPTRPFLAALSHLGLPNPVWRKSGDGFAACRGIQWSQKSCTIHTLQQPIMLEKALCIYMVRLGLWMGARGEGACNGNSRVLVLLYVYGYARKWFISNTCTHTKITQMRV